MPLAKNAVPDVYVLWHPKCVLGEIIAKEISAWLRPGFALGPRVFYRSLPAPGAPADGLPLAIPGESRSSGSSGVAIVIPLIDENMIADATWRYWLEALAQKGSPLATRHVMPVAMDTTAYGAPAVVRELNFIRPKSSGRLQDLDDAAVRALRRSLIKQLTEALCRLLLGTTESDGGPSSLKLKVFLSHAKADGTEPARRVRDYIYSQTQLAAFFDENDIPFGSAFERVLANEATSTVALIAVRSAKYSSRPWCRREISLFRAPRSSPIAGAPNGNDLWKLSPVLVVDALAGEIATPGIPEFGNAPAIRWTNDVPVQEEYIVTTLLRDALLGEFHARMAETLPLSAGEIVLNWLPDPITLLRIPAIRQAAAPVTVHYPGHLSALELDAMWELFPQVTLKSFEQGQS